MDRWDVNRANAKQIWCLCNIASPTSCVSGGDWKRMHSLWGPPGAERTRDDGPLPPPPRAHLRPSKQQTRVDYHHLVAGLVLGGLENSEMARGSLLQTADWARRRTGRLFCRARNSTTFQLSSGIPSNASTPLSHAPAWRNDQRRYGMQKFTAWSVMIEAALGVTSWPVSPLTLTLPPRC